MKMTPLLSITLLFGAALASVQAQDFRSVPPTQQPNAAELAYLGGENPNAIARRPGLEKQSDKAAVSLVTGFLADLATNQSEAVHKRLADGFVACSPGYDDELETNDLLNQWERNGTLFTDQLLTLESSSVKTVPTGNNRGTWVYLRMVCSATERSEPGKPLRIPFHQLARVNHGLIETDPLFYDAPATRLGFSLYATGSEVTQKR